MHLNISSIINKELQWNLTNEVLKKKLLGRKMKNIWSWNRIKEKHMTIFILFYHKAWWKKYNENICYGIWWKLNTFREKTKYL